jgi:hypothetical protein
MSIQIGTIDTHVSREWDKMHYKHIEETRFRVWNGQKWVKDIIGIRTAQILANQYRTRKLNLNGEVQ